MKTALFPGTFDPFTLGHASIVNRGLNLFDRIVIGIGINSDKKALFSPKERMEQIQACYADEPRVEVCFYEGLTVDIAKEIGAAYILRGVRTITDFEYELLLSDVNRKLTGIETVCLFAESQMAGIQSNVVRDLLKFNKDVRDYLPEAICKLLKK
ncbi:MAG: pantetheine-phosphate adenylyltransferase [Bacteroidota bacterium]|nr:pantetheine-phosphate adenylyltransferase [Bacteroidota bacterium]